MKTKSDITSSFGNARRSMAWTVLCLALCMLGLTVSAAAQGGFFVTFDAPGAGTIPNPTWGMGTFAFSINDLGEIAGWFVDDNELHHGYLRTPDGRFSTFQYSGAGTGFCQGTLAWEVNSLGVIAGHYIDSANVFHGFVRALDGRITPFSAEGAGTVAETCGGQGTYVAGINQAGTIAGSYADENWNSHGYVRTPDGRITPFDPTGSVYTYENYGSIINRFGVIAGTYAVCLNAGCTDGVWYGFLRTPDGKITTLVDPDAATDGWNGTYTDSINDNGTILGNYYDGNGASHGFVLTPDNTYTTFDPTGAVETYPWTMNSAGASTGSFVDTYGVTHGFLRTPGGKITTIDVPGATGTSPAYINDLGAITGFYNDASGMTHGFLWVP